MPRHSLALALAMTIGCGGAASLTDAGPDAGSDAGADAGPPPVEWPNDGAPAASDPWIVEHHDEITAMRPRVLALNFVNARDNTQMEALFEAIFAAIREATRPHGSEDPTAQPFLQYEIARSVDLRDPAPPAGWPYNNSTLYPRESPPQGQWSFDYGALFTGAFAERYGFPDPSTPGRYLTLCELSERGLVHEVWIYGDADVPDVAAAEVLAITPRYDESGARLDLPLDPCSGNGCFDPDDAIPTDCTRTLRIGWVNSTRGVGCYLESLGHGIESLGQGSSRPYFGRYFRELAGFDLDDRYGVAFESWYACGGSCLSYPSSSSVAYTDVGGRDGTIDPYVPVCGNAHFPPNARGHYDIVNPQEVLSTCRDYRRGSDAGADRAVAVSAADWARYRDLAPDCTGAFAVWWWQSFPGVERRARDANGEPMRNLWPFLYY